MVNRNHVLNTYLESKVEVREVGTLGGLEDVLFQVHVSCFVGLKHSLLVDLFQSIVLALEVHKRDFSIGTAAEIFYFLEVLLCQVLKVYRNWVFRL